MAMDPRRLAKTMMTTWNMFKADKNTVNNLGDQMYDLMMSIKMSQDSDPDGTLARERFRKMAKAILDGYTNEAGKTTEYRFNRLAEAIINEIRLNAEIAPLTVTNTPADGPGHTHAPAVTVRAGRKII